MGRLKLLGKDRIIFPLDVPTIKQASTLVQCLKDEVGMFKIGLTFFIGEGFGGLRRVHEMVGDRIFLDLKFHDIPETVAEASSALMASHVPFQFMTVHASDGQDIVRAAVRRAQPVTKVLGITVLTHLTDGDLLATGANQNVSERVLTLARVTKMAGGAGVVCSSQEVGSIKSELGREFLVVTPGIRPQWSQVTQDDQRRVMTPGEAMRNGADYVVIGRPISRAPDPAEAARRTAAEIEDALTR